MPRKKTLICIKCKVSETKDGKYCNKCRNDSRKEYFQKRYVDKGSYAWHRTITYKFKNRQELLRKASKKCERCGWNEVSEVFEVHHKDRNRDNNELSNLELLCPNCHQVHHFIEETGRFNRIFKG